MKTKIYMKGFLAITMLLCTTHTWAYDFEVDNIQYTVISLDELTVEVSGLTDENVTEVIIPETVEYRSRVLTVTTMASGVFKGNSTLLSVSVPTTVMSISKEAFYNCTALSQLNQLECIQTIEDYAFYGCTSLSSLTLGNSLQTIGSYAFYSCTSLSSLTLGNSLQTIGSYAFYKCTSLTKISLPEGLQVIEDYVFSGCSSLSSVVLGDSLQTIGSYAFSGCISLSSVLLGNELQSIGKYAFDKCTSLSQISLPESVQTLGEYTFSSSGLISFNLPECITVIPQYCFNECTSLKEIHLPSELESIETYAFYNCSSLKVLDIPDNLTSLDTYALHGCNGLESLYIGSGLDYLLDYTYNYTDTHSCHYQYYYPLLWEDGPSEMRSIVIKDDGSQFRVRGYGMYYYYSSYLKKYTGYPLFSNINIGYYYVGRPLTDIERWSYSTSYEISVSQPYGTIQTLEIGGYCIDVPYFCQSMEYLILGEDVKTFTTSNIYQSDMKGILCKSTTPPTLDGTFDNSTYMDVVLYVPKGSKDTYQATDGWKEFWEIQEMDVEDMTPEYTSVEHIATNTQAESREIFTVSGQKINAPRRGINIFRYSDGTTKKVLVK